ncbi:hypothetical protein B0H13DRAFT_1614147, partial [Mycena leptocephala]
NQAGTFWYHNHLSTQYCHGLRGPLVVYDPLNPHAYLYGIYYYLFTTRFV